MPRFSDRSALHASHPELPSGVWEKLEPILERFENAWRRGERPHLDDYLQAEGAARQALLIELVHEDIEYRLRAGEAVRVADYLRRFPDLRADSAAALELIVAECTRCPGNGCASTVVEYLQGSPEDVQPLAARLTAGVRQSDVRRAGQETTVDFHRTDEESGKDVMPATRTRREAGEAAQPPSVEYPRIHGYEILGTLGKGGMGVVYKARQIKADRLVALKMILHGDHEDDAGRDRFRTEAESIARLQHPHIVQIYEIGEVNGLPYFSLEFCPGGSLDKQLKGTPLPPMEAAGLVETLARAMDAAHNAGVVHRDLKPANILLSAELGTGSAELPWLRTPRSEFRVPKITDFGLAKKVDEAGQTASGAIMGTPSYMAPEQAGGRTKEVGPLADVYALGAVLYECLTGRPPFKAATVMDTLMQVLSDEPVPPTRINAKVPRDLEVLCLKCLQKEARQRYGSALELAEDLRRFRGGEPIKARPVSTLERGAKWVKRNRGLSAALAAAVLALLVGTGVSVWQAIVATRAANGEARQREEAFKQTNIAIGQTSLAQEKERDAVKQADKAKKAQAFLASIFLLSDPDRPGETFTARQILDDAERRIPVEFAKHPELQGELLATIEGVYAKLQANAPLAMLLEVHGRVELDSAKSGKKTPKPSGLLYEGDRLTLGGDASAQVVVLHDLHKERFKPGSEVIIRRKGCEPVAAVSERSNEVMWTFARLPKATFYMGCNGRTSGVGIEIREGFEIACHALTQGQWHAVMGTNPSYFSRVGVGRNEVKGLTDEELKLLPVETVSWNDAQDFIKKLNEKELGSGFVYRLPLEKEWEYACRAGATSVEECSFLFYGSSAESVGGKTGALPQTPGFSRHGSGVQRGQRKKKHPWQVGPARG